MHCPFCADSDTRVVDSRPAEQGAAIRRRRQCAACGERFTTYERAETQLMVRKRGGSFEPFQVDKLRRGLASALADRPVPVDRLSDIVASIERSARSHAPVVESDEIGRLVLVHLRAVDEVAYLRFASVYKEFQGASDFEREMAALDAESDS